MPIADRAIGLALFVGTTLYLVSLPHNLGHADEAFFLYHARRILEGQVVFRDFHELYTPLPHYGVALLYRLFGTSMETATRGFALWHAGVAVVAFIAARRLGARPALAALAGLAYPALCEAAWPHASPHWVATGLMLGLLVVLVERRTSRALLRAGLLTGLLFCAQHQKAVPLAIGVAALLALDTGIDRRLGTAGPSLARRLGLFAAPACAVGAAFLLVHGALAGFGPVLTQLVVEPFTHYRPLNRASWGSVPAVASSLAPFTSVWLLRLLPLLLIVLCVRACLAWRGRDRPALDRLVLEIVLPAAAALSIWYFPDFIHIAFVAPLFFAAGCETLEAVWQRAGRAPAARALGLALVAAAGAGLLLQLRANAERFRAGFPHSLETAFGRVDVASAEEKRLVEAVIERLRGAGVTELLAHPAYISLYLMTGTQNPSPHDYAIAGYKSPRQLREIRDVVRDRELPFVYVMPDLTPRSDPVFRYVRRRYECDLRREPPKPGGRGPCVLYRRRPGPAGS